MKKTISALLAVCLLCSCFLFSGCGHKTPVSPEKFRKVMKANGLAVTDLTTEKGKTLISLHLVGTNDDIIINYMILCDESNAEVVYEELASGFQEKLKGKTKQKDHRAFYSGSDKNDSYYVAYNGNVVFVGHAVHSEHKTAEKMLKKLHVR